MEPRPSDLKFSQDELHRWISRSEDLQKELDFVKVKISKIEKLFLTNSKIGVCGLCIEYFNEKSLKQTCGRVECVGRLLCLPCFSSISLGRDPQKMKCPKCSLVLCEGCSYLYPGGECSEKCCKK